MRDLLERALSDLSILAGDRTGPSDATWRDVAGTASANLKTLVWCIDEVREYRGGPFPVFPSPADELGRERERA
jgi:hypothetical protein